MTQNSNPTFTSALRGSPEAVSRLKNSNVFARFIRPSVLSALLAIFGLTTLPAFSQTSGCNLNTVNGSYGVLANGSILSVGPLVATGIFTTNGPGRFTYSFAQNIAGSVSSDTIRGTYTLNADCTGTVTFENGQTFAAVVVNGGSEIDLISTGPTFLVQTVVARRIP